MDVVNGEQARLAEAAGAVAVMALKRIPADIKRDGGVARSSDPAMITEVMAATSLPVMAKSRIGNFYEARILEALGVDFIDESEVLTAADEANHIDKRGFKIPFVCGAQDLGEALRRIAEGASMIRLKGNAGTGNVVQAVRHARAIYSQIRQHSCLRPEEIFTFAKEHRVPVELVEQVRAAGRLPVVTFAAGGLATPADVALLMELSVDGVFVGLSIFKRREPRAPCRRNVRACSHFRDPAVEAEPRPTWARPWLGCSSTRTPPPPSASTTWGLRARPSAPLRTLSAASISLSPLETGGPAAWRAGAAPRAESPCRRPAAAYRRLPPPPRIARHQSPVSNRREAVLLPAAFAGLCTRSHAVPLSARRGLCARSHETRRLLNSASGKASGPAP